MYPERHVTVHLETTGQGGAGEDDHSAVPTTIRFAVEDTQRTFTFEAAQDSLDDDDESVKVALGTLPAGLSEGTNPSTVISITDDDDPAVTVSFEHGAYTVAETDDPATTEVQENRAAIKVKLSTDPERTVTIPVTRTNQDRTSNQDYSGVPENLTFNAGDTERTIIFSATADALDDNGESVTLGFGTDLPEGVSQSGTTQTVVSITDDDADGVTINPPRLSVNEDGNNTYTVVLDTEPTQDVTVTVNDPTDNTGVTADPDSLTFTPQDWNAPQTVTVSAAQDDNAVDETAVVTHTVEGYTGMPTAEDVHITVVDDAPRSLTAAFAQGSHAVDEGDSVTLRVRLNTDPKRTVRIEITKENQGGATPPDHSGVPIRVTFRRGDTKKEIAFAATQDTYDDDDESVTLGFGPLPPGVTAGTPDETTVSITDDDVPPVSVAFEQSHYTALEGDDTSTMGVKENEVTIKVILSADPERTITVRITKVEQDGATSADYSGVPASVEFAPGETEQTITFAATDDGDNDDGESVKLGFENLPDRVSAGTNSETVISITDDDLTPVEVSFEQPEYTVAEGSGITVNVRLNQDPGRTLSIPITTTNQGGASTADHRGVPTSLEFSPGDTEKSITFNAEEDSDNDDGESVKLGFGSTLPDGVSASGTTETTVNITDDDVPSVAVSFEQDTYTVLEGNTVSVNVKLDQTPERTVTIPITKANQNGAEDSDYSIVPSNVTFDSGETEKNIAFAATDDDADDDGESVRLGFGTMPTGVSAGTPRESTVNITDDDLPTLTVSFEQPTHTVRETDDTSTTELRENEVTVRVTLSAAPERRVLINLNRHDQHGATQADYDFAPICFCVDFASDETQDTITLTMKHDNIDDRGESVRITMASLPARVSFGTNSETTVNIEDDDAAGVTVDPVRLSVNEGSTNTYTVVLHTEPTADVTVTIHDPTDNTDVTAEPSSLTFTDQDWNMEQTVSVAAAQDDNAGDENATITHTVAGYAEVATAADVTVAVADDAPASLMVSFDQENYTVDEGDTVTLRVRLNVDPNRTVQIPITTTNQDGATVPDYSGVPTSITFRRGETEKEITFEAAQDTIDDDGESVTLGFGQMPTGVSVGTTSQVTVRITDDDVPQVDASFSAATYTAPEGGSVEVKVTLNQAPERQLVILIDKANQGETSDSDYSGVPEDLTFEATDTEKTFTFAAADDDEDDDGESVKLTLSTFHTGVSAGRHIQAVVNVTDSDVPTVTVSFKESSYTVHEGDTVTVTLELSADPERSVEIPILRADQGSTTSADH